MPASLLRCVLRRVSGTNPIVLRYSSDNSEQDRHNKDERCTGSSHCGQSIDVPCPLPSLVHGRLPTIGDCREPTP